MVEEFWIAFSWQVVISSLILILFRFIFLQLQIRKENGFLNREKDSSRFASWALLLGSGGWVLFSQGNDRIQEGFTFLSFGALLISCWLKENKKFHIGQKILLNITWLMAGLNVLRGPSLIEGLGWEEMPSLLLTAGLVALVTLGYSRLMLFSFLPSLWTVFLIFSWFLISNPLWPDVTGWLGMTVLIGINTLWSLIKKESEVHSIGAMWMGYWLTQHTLTLQVTGDSSLNLLIWLTLFSLPLIEGVSYLVLLYQDHARGMTWGKATFLAHIKDLNLNKHQTLFFIFGFGFYSLISAVTWLEMKDHPFNSHVILMGLTGMMFFVGFTYLFQHQRKNHVHNVSQTLLHRYLKLQKNVSVNLKQFQSVIYDLLPYYREVEKKGIGEVQEFLHDFGEYLRNLHAGQPVLLVGSYTILIVEEKIEPPGRYLTQVNQAFSVFLESKGLNRTTSLGYFSSQSKSQLFMQRFGHLIIPQNEQNEVEGSSVTRETPTTQNNSQQMNVA